MFSNKQSILKEIILTKGTNICSVGGETIEDCLVDEMGRIFDVKTTL